MRRLVLVALAALTCGALTGWDQIVSAQTWINVEQCDSIQANGQECSRITFGVHDKADSDQIIYMRLFIPTYPVPGDTCHVLQATAPLGWSSSIEHDGGAFWGSNYPRGGIVPGQTQGGFQMILSRPTCCVLFQFSNYFEPFGDADVCFACPFATPDQRKTWGALKVKYRFSFRDHGESSCFSRDSRYPRNRCFRFRRSSLWL